MEKQALSTETTGRTKVLIIGGGVGGCYLAKKLSRYPHLFEFTIFSPTVYFELSPSLAQLIFDSSDSRFKSRYNKLAKIDLSKYVGKNGRIVQQLVTNVSNDRVVTLQDGSQHQGDIVICASGLRLGSPWKPKFEVHSQQQRWDEITEFRDKLTKSNTVLIIGGGIIGVETAAHIAVSFPKKRVHLVQKASRLTPEQTASFGNLSKKFLTSHKCYVHLGSICTKTDEGYLLHPHDDESKTLPWDETSSIEEKPYLKPDLVVQCVGGKPNSDYLAAEFKNERGQIVVDDYLRVVGANNIFAIGDVNNVKVGKTAQTTLFQAGNCFNNIYAITKNKDPSRIRLEKFYPSDVIFLVPLGPYRAIVGNSTVGFSGIFCDGSITLRIARELVDYKLRYTF